MRSHIYHGSALPYAPSGTAIESDQLVAVGGVLAVAESDIADGVTGNLAIEGVFEVAKVTGNAAAQGQALIFDASAAAMDTDAATPATGDVTGAAWAWEAAAADATTIKIKLIGQAGAVTA